MNLTDYQRYAKTQQFCITWKEGNLQTGEKEILRIEKRRKVITLMESNTLSEKL